jgi:hypothetical protein
VTLFKERARWLLAISGIFVGTLASPVLLFGISRIFHEEWITVANIGQTYGFASAALSGLALLAVAYSLIIQQNESRVMRAENQRMLHTELLRMGIEDPSLIGVVLIDPSESVELKRRRLYANLIIQSMKISYTHSRVLNDESIREEAGYMFGGIVGRTYWERRREAFREDAASPRERAFFEILDEAYARSLQGGPPLSYPKG